MPQIHFIVSSLQIHDFAQALNLSFTILSSSEWNEIIATFAFFIFSIFFKNLLSSPNSSLTSIRNAWNTRVAGCILELILELDSIIASSEATVSEKNVALEEKKYLISLTEKELLLETELITSGYQDVFVHASSYGVEITVISEINSVLMASQIIKKAKEDFHDIESVQVIFKTESEVMGNATLNWCKNV